jgi:hypothetical protein
MSKIQTAPIAGFTPGERDYIRRELDMFFSTLPSVAEGFHLKTWCDGTEAGKPKLSPIAKGLVERGLMRLDTSQRNVSTTLIQPGSEFKLDSSASIETLLSGQDGWPFVLALAA